MSGRNPPGVLRDIATLLNSGTLGGLTDKQLLDRFVNRDDPSSDDAFTILIERHGPMVWGVCRRILPDDHHAASDAFKATFLVLVRKAPAIRLQDSLAPWLYGVSRRVATRARATSQRQNSRETASVEALTAPAADPSYLELLNILDQEIGRLPESQRATVVLCDLEGLPHQEAARRLGCPVGTVESRLHRARQRLRDRLIRRGLAPTAATLYAQTAREASAAIPQTLINHTAHLITASPASTALPVTVATLAQGVIHTMSLANLKPLAAVAAILILATTGVAVQQRQNADGNAAPSQAKIAPQKPAAAAPPPPISPEEAANRALARQQLPLIDNALAMMHRLAENSRFESGDAAFSLWERRRLDTLRQAGATKAEIVEALEKELKVLEKEEATAKKLFAGARTIELAIFDVQFRKFQTQIWLNEEKAR